MKYSQKLKDPKWTAKRLEILKLKGENCSLCGNSNGTPEVHHGYYTPFKEPWEYDNDSLWVLCRKCHDKTHRELEIIHRIIGLIDPKDLESFKNKLPDYTFHFENGISNEEVTKIINEEQNALIELYMEYTVIIFSSCDLGETRAYKIANDAESIFPGLNVNVEEIENETDGFANITGPNSEIVLQLEEWFERTKNQIEYL